MENQGEKARAHFKIATRTTQKSTVRAREQHEQLSKKRRFVVLGALKKIYQETSLLSFERYTKSDR